MALIGCDAGPPQESVEGNMTAPDENGPMAVPANTADVGTNGAAEELPSYEPPPSPVPAGYRAVGNEPGWMLTIGGEEIVYIGDYGEVRITQPKPKASIGIAGETYRTPRLDVNIVHGRCRDGMSDYVYADKVQVTADGKRVDGCGGERHLPPGASPP